MKAVAVLLIKGFIGAKSRLAPILSPAERATFTRAMFEDVFAAVRDSEVDEIVVVSPDTEALRVASLKGARCILEAFPQGMNTAFRRSLGYCSNAGTDVLVCVPCDLPLLEKEDIQFVMERAESGPRVVLSPSTGSAGTSLLALNPPGAIPFRFEEDSYLLHVQEAEKRGIPVVIYERPSASLDVDESKDLEAVLSSGKEGETKRLLKKLEVARRLASIKK